MAYPFEASNPIYLIIDTNYWLYMLEGEYSNIFEGIVEKVNNEDEDFKVVISDSLRKEWKKHKQQVIETANKNIVYLEKIEKFASGTEKATIKSAVTILRRLDVERKTQVADKIDKIFTEKAIIAEETPEVKNYVIKHGLEKFAPFKGKNGTADALIFFSAIEYIKKERGTGKNINAIFVTANYTDFSASKDKRNEIHSDLASYLEETGMQFDNNIANAFNLANELQSQVEDYISKSIDDYIEEQLERAAMYMLDIKRGK